MSAFFNKMDMGLDLKELIDSIEVFDPEAEVIQIVEENTAKIADMQRDQMLEGRGVDGDFIRPYYSENPYFKTPEAAKRYAKWKQKITPNPQRPEDVPNLTINNFFHNSLSSKVDGDEFEIETDASFGEDVFSVHKNARGLNEEKRLLFAENITLPKFAQVLKEKTGLEI
jgi:hypothetical protein